MKRSYLALLLVAACSMSHASSKVWESGWGQGVTEFSVGDEKANSLFFSCNADDEEKTVSASATINGKPFDSHGENGGFDVVVDGVEFSNPFNVDCRVCAGWFEPFWKALRKANKIEIRANGQSAQIPVKGLSQLLKPYKSAENPCVANAW
ncbi:hypothetical protein PS3A_03300 [Pseudomonas sp. 3A(2025)]